MNYTKEIEDIRQTDVLVICGNRVLHDATRFSGSGLWFGEKGLTRFEDRLHPGVADGKMMAELVEIDRLMQKGDRG